ncbi:MAG: RHS repeat-associated core domain-containing protein, partial [Candidatus Obscuribacterales bacterium]|nr:RHS repeat-associated core domain-containing protein [Candidatus Obscuribacterales bacterium]
DAENRIWQYSHDSLGRLSLVTDPMGNAAETRTYTDNGRLASIEDASGNVTNYTFDGFDRLDKTIFPDTSYEQSSYDKNSNLTNFRTRKADDITNTFDVLNRLSTRQPGSLPLQTMTYDLAGRLLNINTLTDPGDPTSGDYSWNYDGAGRLNEQTTPDSKTISYQLDENGNRTRLTYPDSYYAEYVFDELNRLTDIKLNGATTAAVHFDYDELSRRTALTYENGVTCSYAYSLNNDMTALEHSFTGSSVAYTFTNDKVHQITSTDCDNSDFVWTPNSKIAQSYAAANSLNQYPAVNGNNYSYNENGCQTAGPLSASFDDLNRLTEASTGSSTVDYLYDPVNRQGQKTVDTTNTGFLYDGLQLVSEYDNAGDLSARYIRGNRLDEIFIRIDSSATSYFHQDLLGSPIAQTDDSGAVTAINKYGPFGQTDGSISAPFGFTGQRYEPSLALYNYKARYYSPANGRFLQPDPIAFAGDDLNLYGYVGNNPVSWVDQFGLLNTSKPKSKLPVVNSNKTPGWTPNCPPLSLLPWDMSASMQKLQNYAGYVGRSYGITSISSFAQANALRHALSSAYIAYQTSTLTAIEGGLVHEFDTTIRRDLFQGKGITQDTWVDIHNNNTGARIAGEVAAAGGNWSQIENAIVNAVQSTDSTGRIPASNYFPQPKY